ncbi:MAG: hypothetical protein WAK55_23310 [Xanthobacteraceae bacterium]
MPASQSTETTTTEKTLIRFVLHNICSVTVPVLMATLDLVENGCIAVMLWTWPDLSHGLVEVSSLATRVKIMAGVLTEALMARLR